MSKEKRAKKARKSAVTIFGTKKKMKTRGTEKSEEKGRKEKS
jgi:hypothetical protein